MKLNIGGKIKKDGWKILNAQESDEVDYVGNFNDLSRFEEESFSEVYASHVLEHIEQKKIHSTLLGVNRILKPKGKFYISVPDIDVLFKFFINQPDKKIKFHVMRMIFGAQDDKYDFHYIGWNFEFLYDFLSQANFTQIKKVNSFGLFNDTSEYNPYGFPISLNVISIKQ